MYIHKNVQLPENQFSSVSIPHIINVGIALDIQI